MELGSVAIIIKWRCCWLLLCMQVGSIVERVISGVRMRQTRCYICGGGDTPLLTMPTTTTTTTTARFDHLNAPQCKMHIVTAS